MSLLKKYKKTIALALIASSATSLAPAKLQALDLDGLKSILATIADLDTKYQIDKLLDQADSIITDYNYSEFGGLDLDNGTEFIDSSDPNFIELKELLETDSNFDNIGGLAQVEKFVAELKALMETMGTFDAAGEFTLKSDMLQTSDVQTYIDNLIELKKYIYVAHTHMNLSVDEPVINFDGTEYAFAESEYGDTKLLGGYKAIHVSDPNLVANYPVPDLTWPHGKPDNIKLGIFDAYTYTPFVNEIISTDSTGINSYVLDEYTISDDLPYEANKTFGSVDASYMGGQIIYKIIDINTGKSNYFNLILEDHSARSGINPKSISKNLSRTSNPRPGDLSDIENTTVAVEIKISETGVELKNDVYWVTPEIQQNLQMAINKAVDILKNAYQFFDTGDVSAFNSLEVTWIDENEVEQTEEAVNPDGSKVLWNNLPTTGDHSTWDNVDTMLTNLKSAYETYYTSAQLGSSVAEVNLKNAKLETKIAKAMLGLRNLSVPLPELPLSKDDTELDNLFYSSLLVSDVGPAITPVYLYTRKATQDDVDDLVDSLINPDASVILGEPVATTKDLADDILYYEAHIDGLVLPSLENLTEGVDYFIAPVLSKDPYTNGAEIPGGQYSGLTEAEAQLYLTPADIEAQIAKLNPILANYDKYNGTDEFGNQLGGQSYYDEVLAGLEMTADGITNIEKVIEDVKNAVSEYPIKEGEQYKKELALENLAKLLIHLGYVKTLGADAAPDDIKYNLFGINIGIVADPVLKDIEPYKGGTNSARDAAKQSFDVYKNADLDLGSIDVRLGTDDSEAFYNVSNVLGVDIEDGQLWVSEEANTELKEAAQRAHDLIDSQLIFQTKNDGTTTQPPADSDLEDIFYTTELVNAEVDALNNALKKYDNSATLSIKELFNNYIANVEKKFFNPDALSIDDYFELPKYDANGRIEEQLVIDHATSNTFLSTDGIYAITRQILSKSVATGDAVSQIENKQLITGLVDTATAQTHFYAELDDFNSVIKEVKPLLAIVDLKEQLLDAATFFADDNLVAQLKEVVRKFKAFELQELEQGVDTAIEVFEASKKPIVTYAETRDVLKNTVNGTDYTIIKRDADNNNMLYIDDATLVISDDEGFSYKKYDALNNEWSEDVMTDDLEWVSSADLKEFNTAIEKANAFIVNTRPTVYEIEPGETSGSPDQTKDTVVENPLDDEPVAGTKYAKVDFDPAILGQITTALESGSDIFVEAGTTLKAAQAKFANAPQGPNPNLKPAEEAYKNFKDEVGSSYTYDSTSTSSVPATQKTLGYVSRSAVTIPTPAPTGIKSKVYARLDADGNPIDYFPVGTYVTNDSLGIINPITGHLYGYKDDTDPADPPIVDASAPPTLVAKNIADKLIQEIEIIDKFMEKPLTEHFQSYSLDNNYFDNALASLKNADQAFVDNNLSHKASDFVNAYKAVQAQITTGAGASTALKADVSKFKVVNDSPSEATALKLEASDYEGLDDPGPIEAKDDIVLDSDTDKVYISEDGITSEGKTGGDLSATTNDHWVTPEMFDRLKNAIWSIQGIVNDAKKLDRSTVAGFAADPDNYFANQVAQSDLEAAKENFIVTKVLGGIDENDSTDVEHWIKEAKIILYGKITTESGGATTIEADGPGGEGEQADANVSELLDGFDVLTLGILQAADPDADGLDEAELKSFRGENKVEYITKEYADQLRNALATVEAEASKENLEELAKLVNAKVANVKIASVSNNVKIDLYNSYIETLGKLKDANGQDIESSDNKGANVPTDRYWITSAQYKNLKTAIETSEKLLNTTETLKTGENLYTNQVKAQVLANQRAGNFVLTPGAASREVVEDLNVDKSILLETINKATDLAGTQRYQEDGTIDINSVLSDEKIVVSTKYGLDVFGEDLDGNMVPDTGDRWTTAGALTAIKRSITAAATAYNSAAATSVSIQKAKDTLDIAIKNFENGAKYGTASTYQKVVNSMNKLIENLEFGNEGYEGTGANGAPIIKLEDIKISTVSGADCPASQLWTTTPEKTKISNLKTATEKVLAERANIAENLVKMDLTALVVEYNRLRVAYESFYGRDINGQVIETIVAKALPGTDALETFDLKTQIAIAVGKINDLVYLPGANRPVLKYTKFDGTPLNEYDFDKYDIAKSEYINDEDRAGDGGSYEDIHVSSKVGGIDIPVGVKWISTITLNKYAQAINVAQQALDKFEMAEDKAQNQATLNNSIRALEAATILFEGSVQGEKISLNEESMAYNNAYTMLSDAIERAASLINPEGLLSGDSGLLIIPSEIISIRTSLSGDGQDVSSNYHWVPIGNLNGYNGAINTAKNVLNATGSLTIAYEKGLENLQKATNGICNLALTRPGLADEREATKADLEEKILEAETLLYGTKKSSDGPNGYPLAESPNGLDISENRNWTTTPSYNRIRNAITAAKNVILNLETENGGTGKATVAQLRVAQNNIVNALNLAAIKQGDLSEDTESEIASLLRSNLRTLMNEVTALLKYRQSAKEGRDTPDGVNWVTNATMSFELAEGKNESLTPIKFLDTAYKAANAIYVKKYTDMDVATIDYRTAINNLDYCIKQFNNVASNIQPNGTANDSNTATGGLGSLTSITAAKKVLADKINKVNADIITTVESNDETGTNVADGRWFATKGNLDTIKGAVTAARTALNSLEATVETLTAGSLDGLTSETDQIAEPTSALGILNKAYELFAGVDDSNALTNIGINDGTEAQAQHRKLKGHLNPYSEHDATPLGLAAAAIVELFNETNAPTIPLDFVLDNTTGVVDPATNSSDLVKATDIKAYIETLIINAIDNDEITVTVTLATNGGYTAPTDQDTSAGLISGFTVELVDADHPVATKWTIGSGATDTALDDTEFFSEATTTLQVKIPQLVDKWNDITKADIYNAVGLIDVNKESFVVSDSLFDYDKASKDATDPTTDGTNTKVISSFIKKQIEELINNPAIEVNLFAKDVAAGDDFFSSNTAAKKPLTDSSTIIGPAATADDAITANPTRPTADEEGEEGKFEFKVLLSIPFDEATGISSRAGITDKFEEVVDDNSDGTAEDKDVYTVLFKEAITATIKPEPYKVATTADIIAVNLAKKAISVAHPFTIKNEIGDLGNTIALANAQIVEQVHELLGKLDENNKKLIKDVKISVVEDFTGTNTGFVAPTEHDSTNANGTDGRYQFNIVFTQNNATAIVMDTTSTPHKPVAFSVDIDATPYDALKDVKRKIEKFEELCKGDGSEEEIIFNDKTAGDEGAALGLMAEAIGRAAGGSGITYEVIDSEYKAPIKATFNKAGIAGWLKFGVKLNDGVREAETFEINVAVKATAYEAPESYMMMGGVDIPEQTMEYDYVAVINAFEEEMEMYSDYYNYYEENFEEEYLEYEETYFEEAEEMEIEFEEEHEEEFIEFKEELIGFEEEIEF